MTINPENYDPVREANMQLDVIKRLDMMINNGILPPDYLPIRVSNYNLDILWRLDTLGELIKNGSIGGGGGTPTHKSILMSDNYLLLDNLYDFTYVKSQYENGDLYIDFDYNVFTKIRSGALIVENLTGIDCNVNIKAVNPGSKDPIPINIRFVTAYDPHLSNYTFRASAYWVVRIFFEVIEVTAMNSVVLVNYVLF